MRPLAPIVDVDGDRRRASGHRANQFYGGATQVILVVTWIWVVLRALVGDEAAQSDAMMGSPLVVAGMLCLAGLLLVRDGAPLLSGQGVLQPVGQSRRRRPARIVRDHRRNGIAVLTRRAPPRRRASISQVRSTGTPRRAAKIIRRSVIAPSFDEGRSRQVA